MGVVLFILFLIGISMMGIDLNEGYMDIKEVKEVEDNEDCEEVD